MSCCMYFTTAPMKSGEGLIVRAKQVAQGQELLEVLEIRGLDAAAQQAWSTAKSAWQAARGGGQGPWGKIATFAFRVAGPVYAVIDALNVAQAWNEEPRDLGKVALRSVALAGTLVCAAVAFAPAAVIGASTAAFVGAGAAGAGAARLAEHFYEKSKEAPTPPTVPVQVSAA